jgi:GH25 family lysozyme M1 (1,4-beta-N-acetylmuramidase)
MPKPLVIDLSHHNTIGSLHDAAAAGIVGVIHKATEGVKMVDKTAKSRFALSRDAGLLWGVYHFMKPGDVETQVDHFLKNAPADDKTLYVLDFEVDGITLSQVLEFLELVDDRTGQIPVLYTGFKLKDLGGARKIPALTAYRLWLAQYGPRPVLPKGYDKLWLWQYTQTGKIAGVSGDVDLNEYNGTAEQLRDDWVIKTSAAAPLASSEQGGLDQSNNSADSTTQGQPPNTFTAEITPDGGVKVATSDTKPTEKERIAVVAAEKQKWTTKVSAKVTGAGHRWKRSAGYLFQR